jgi:serine phosphatase RsbU (regulator of sigma subunit)/CHASE3 domain sensor protein
VTSRSIRPLLATIAGLAVVVLVIIVGGLYQRTLIQDAFANTEASAHAERELHQVLEDQLDLETGMRGYAATHQRLYLEPYNSAKERIDHDIAALLTSLRAVDPSQLSLVDDVRTTSRTWLATVARPVVGGNFGRLKYLSTHHVGKALVDRIRDDVTVIDLELASRDRVESAATRDAIDRILYAVVIGVVVIVAFGIAYAVQQARLAAKADEARAALDDERLRAQEMRVLYNAEKRIADSLQDAIAQRPLPTLPSLRFSATYVPALEESKVGGDWYDALELPGNRVLFAIGDVAGHGLGAAVAMSRARQALVTSAILDADPALVLKRVNDELLRQKAPMVTAVTGYADAERYEFVFALAGHPPPLLVEPGREPRFLSCGGLPLGVDAAAAYVTHRVQTMPGAMLVLYTDGAVEHTHDVLEGEEILLAAARSVMERHAGEPSTAIHEAIFKGQPAGDDVAIMTVGFESDPATGLRITAESAQASIAGTLIRNVRPGLMDAPVARLPRRGQMVPMWERKAS